MIRKIIKIDEEKCNGCGLCATACHEGAIDMVNGKARLMREHYCDGLGDCLPACPTGAISFEEREAPEYDHAAVLAQKAAKAPPCGCPGSHSHALAPQMPTASAASSPSQLAQWPVQIRLAPLRAPYFSGAKLLIAADCCAYAHANFHGEFMAGHVTLVGCPKLDPVDYSEKLAEILKDNTIESITVTRMEVPCCGGIEQAVARALAQCGKEIPCRVITLGTDGRVLA